MKFDVSQIWYKKNLHPIAIILLPFSWLFGLGAALRRLLYRIGVFKTCYFNVPVVVVGNLTIGGTGKTPFVIWLAAFLQSHGYHPGIVSRGVGGRKHTIPHSVKQDDAASIVGDEALLLAQNTNCPIVICIDRVAAVRELLKNSNCNIVISDDGLQHYSLGRHLEVVMVDSERRLGNRCLLPAGPLREPESRLRSADMVVMHGGSESDQYTMSLAPVEFISVINSQRKLQFQEFPRHKIHVVAGIGHPQRFFSVLQKAGFDLIAHTFPDHHMYQPRDLDFADSLPILMTEKDAVKCAAFADERYWYLSVKAEVNNALEQAILAKLSESNHENKIDVANGYANRIQHDDLSR